jgi:hypothetical protein
MLSVANEPFMLSVQFYFYYAECRYAECRGADARAQWQVVLFNYILKKMLHKIGDCFCCCVA